MLWEFSFGYDPGMNNCIPFSVSVALIMVLLTACQPVQGGLNNQETQLQVPEAKDTVQRTVPSGHESVFFATQSSELSDAEHKKLMALATAMRMDKTLRARLAGSTENGNPSLALRRAIAVRNILSQMGVRSDRLSVKDEGQSDTILSQQHPETGSNGSGRRVDILIESVTGQSI
ncbi:MAG: ompA family protein [Micavibrio sp.]|nr:ompA family protein [Micavibrio sp.]